MTLINHVSRDIDTCQCVCLPSTNGMLCTMMRPLLTTDRDTWPEGGKKVDELPPLCTETKVRFVAETAVLIILLA
jgi:hypothetical protein